MNAGITFGKLLVYGSRKAVVTIRCTLLAAIAAAALVLAGGAQAFTIQDLPAAGYTVGVAGAYPTGCITYSVSGHGASDYIAVCSDPVVQANVDPGAQATIDSLANPTTIFEADWQANHPEQVTAATTIGTTLCYSITRTAPMTDSWQIVGGGTNVTSSGAGLVALAGSLPSVCNVNPNPVVAIVPNVNGAGAVVQPGDPTPVAAIAAQAAQQTTTTPTTTTTTTTTTPTGVAPTAQAAADAQLAPATPTPQTVTVTTSAKGSSTLAQALTKSVGQPVALSSGTVYLLHGTRTTAHTFLVALRTRHKVKITGSRNHGKLVAKRVTIV